MKNDFDLVYSEEALLNRVLYLASSTEINIFVEDEGKEYEYEEILERLLSDDIKINLIFPTGGKLKLEEAYSLFGQSTEYGKCFFIADGDFDIAVRSGYHCAPYVHDLLGTRDRLGTVRISVGYFTTKSDIDALSDALNEL